MGGWLLVYFRLAMETKNCLLQVGVAVLVKTVDSMVQNLIHHEMEQAWDVPRRIVDMMADVA